MTLAPTTSIAFVNETVHAAESNNELYSDEMLDQSYIASDGTVYMNNEKVVHIEEYTPSQDVFDKHNQVDNNDSNISLRAITTWKLFNIESFIN
ncbi:hypothetical protein [Aerococcus kribbianus]|uniref:Uncharacterized protein n=1 Tax=Aerococcus kribbianus TaxID=2999064 RepID=A0A9X3FNF0_9LACT|nr:MULTISPECIES: hypothetical protein [unclassified Aerococcus]MCZ0716743.1 hypothetical protein [Aerococcus sp. YH-aer221]MCZ0725031.1 hypothetical protein [Aerococcus sp. YH-aer222]